MSTSATPPAVAPPPAADPPPANPPGDNGDGDKDKFRGMRKQLDERDAKIAEYEAAEAKRKEADAAAERKRLEEQGEFKTLAEQAEARAVAAEAAVAAFQANETKRLETVASANKARLEALPEQYQALVPAGLDADAVSAHLGKLEGLAGMKTPATVHGGPPRSGAPASPEEHGQTLHDELKSKFTGGAK